LKVCKKLAGEEKLWKEEVGKGCQKQMDKDEKVTKRQPLRFKTRECPKSPDTDKAGSGHMRTMGSRRQHSQGSSPTTKKVRKKEV